MVNDVDAPHGKAAALLAYALDIEANTIDQDALNKLVDEVCEDDRERARLESHLSTVQNPHLPRVILELLSARLDRLRDKLETAEDMDTVYGVWTQRTAGGATLASVGFLAAGILTGGWAALAICAGLTAAGGTTYGRDRLKKRARTARRAVEQTERLIESIKRSVPQSGE